MKYYMNMEWNMSQVLSICKHMEHSAGENTELGTKKTGDDDD
jgi:hypothetical protein